MKKRLKIIGLVILFFVSSVTLASAAGSFSKISIPRMDKQELEDSTISMLIQFLKDPDKTIRIYAVKGLANIKQIKEEDLIVIIPLFNTLVMDPDSEVREEAKKALDDIFSGKKR